MNQLAMPIAQKSPAKPVNVASVPQRSPFRYPGGKTWLIPQVRRWLGSLPAWPRTLVEPFAGGGIVSLTAVAEGLCGHAHLIEKDVDVGAVWEVIVNGGGPQLAARIMDFQPSLTAVTELLSRVPVTIEERAFHTIVKNRTFHGGILALGSAPVRHGEKGRGIASRWYPETLSRRLLEIHGYRERLSFTSGDGLQRLREEAGADAFFIDPPYTAGGKKAGRRLYAHFELDHEELFRIAETLSGDFLMTYDNAPEVRNLAVEHGFDVEPIRMRNTHLAEMTELLIGRDLTWARLP